MKNTTCAILSFTTVALLGAGCVAIPAGRETYTTEYPFAIRATWDSPTKQYDPDIAVVDGDKDFHSASIALKGKVTSTQPREQQYKTVTVEKKKRLAIGLFPQLAQRTFRPKGSLEPVGDLINNGNGKYSTYPTNSMEPHYQSESGGFLLNFFTFGLVSTPISMFAEIFGPYEKDSHFLGSSLQTTSVSQSGNRVTTSKTYSSTDLDLLCKFPMSEREKIGAWTWHEDDTHPHNSFWHGFEAQWFGVYKYCNYFVKGSSEVTRRASVDPEVTTSSRTVSGPYTATLILPALGYRETVAVEPGAKEATFNLLVAANGEATASGTIRYSLPDDGDKSVKNADDREILKLATVREWPVTVNLPAPRPERIATPGAAPADAVSDAYRVASIENLDGGGLVVRVAVKDAAKAQEADRAVQPEIRRMFREQFATGDNANRRENLKKETADGGKTLVYTVVFE